MLVAGLSDLFRVFSKQKWPSASRFRNANSNAVTEFPEKNQSADVVGGVFSLEPEEVRESDKMGLLL